MNVCMLAYTFYEKDNRVRRYAEALAARGDHVEVFALRENNHSKHEIIKGVHIYRIQKRVFNEKGQSTYLLRLLRFLFKSAFRCTIRHFKVKYDVIHIHSLPDFEVFAAVIPKLFGAKIILDIHDITPELYVSKFNMKMDSFVFKTLLVMEKLSCSFADYVIIANHIWEQRIIERAVKKEKCSTFLNYPDETIFSPIFKKNEDKQNNKVVIVYPGSVSIHQGLDYAIEAFASVHDQIPNAEFRVYGEGSEWERIIQLTKKLNIEQKVVLSKTIPLDEIPRIMKESDIGIVPKRSDSFGNEAFSTKIFEFMTLGVPVLVADTRIDKYYFNDSLVKFFKSGDVHDLAEKMLEIVKDKELRKKLSDNSLEFIKENLWSKHKERYFDLVDTLAGKK